VHGFQTQATKIRIAARKIIEAKYRQAYTLDKSQKYQKTK